MSVIPPRAKEHSDPLGDFLLSVDPRSIFARVGAGSRDVQVIGRCFECRAVVPHVGVVDVGHKPQRAGVPVQFVASFQFHVVGTRPADLEIHRHAVRHFGHHRAAISQRPGAPDYFGRQAVSVAARVRRKIPGPVVHQRPVQKLRTSVMAVIVAVKQIDK